MLISSLRALTLDVRDIGGVVRQLSRTLFVPTNVDAGVGDTVELQLRLPRVKPIHLLVTVVGARKPGGPLVAGLFVMPADDNDPVLAVLHELGKRRLADVQAHFEPAVAA